MALLDFKERDSTMRSSPHEAIPFLCHAHFIKDRQDGILYAKLSMNRGCERFWGLVIDLGFMNR
jgi:hypothetical protein